MFLCHKAGFAAGGDRSRPAGCAARRRTMATARVAAVLALSGVLLSGALPLPVPAPGLASAKSAPTKASPVRSVGSGGSAPSGAGDAGDIPPAFTDTSKHWGRDYIDALLQAGIVAVPRDGRFRPDEPVTRLDFAVWVAKAMELDVAGAGAGAVPGSDADAAAGGTGAVPGGGAAGAAPAPGANGSAAADGNAGFVDEADIPEADRPWVAAAAGAGLISGYPVTVNGEERRAFRPRNRITRVELGTIFGRALVKLGYPLEDRYWYLFEDRGSIPGWAREAVASVQAEVIMGRPGYKLARFAPQARTTRAEAAAMINRFLNARARLLPEARPAPRPSRPKVIVSGYYYRGDARSLKSVQNFGRQLNMAFYFSYQVDGSGNLAGWPPRQAEWDAFRKADVPVLAVVKNSDFSRQQASALLNDDKAADRAVQNILNLMGQGFTGVNLDFENVDPNDRERYAGFVARVAAALRPRGHLTTVALPARTARTAVSSWGRAYDYGAIGQAADYVVVMSYDQHYKGGPPGPVGGADWADEVMAYAASQVKPEKLLLGIPSYGYDWPDPNPPAGGGSGGATNGGVSGGSAAANGGAPANGTGATNGLPAEGNQAAAGPAKARPIYEWEPNPDFYSIEELLVKNGLAPQPDPVTGEVAFRYTDDSGNPRVVYYTDPRGLRLKLDLVRKHGLGGVAMWRLGFEPPDYWYAFAGLTSGVNVAAGGTGGGAR